MPKFDVEITQRNFYEITVEAECEEEAVNKAYAIYNSDKERPDYLFDCDDVYECTKCKDEN